MLQKGEVKEDRETAGGLTMNQYIITEELLQEAMENTTWGRTNQQKFRDKLTPYQSERDTVLELLRLKYVEFLNHPCPELADKYDHCCDVDWCGLCTLDEVLAELRQKAGELR